MSKLYDAYGQPIDTHSLQDELASVTTTGVRSVLAGHPAQGLTPPRLARLLLAAEQGEATAYLELAEEMEEKDGHYRSVLATRKTQIAGLDITVEAASDSAEDVKAADLVRDFVDADIVQHSLFDILDAIGKGFSASEILWDCEGKVWTPRRIVWRDPRWFGFDPLDGTSLRLKDEYGQLTPLAPAKFVVHTHKSKSGLPIRGGLARAATWGYLFKNFDLKAWMIFCEVYGHPLRLGRYGPAASREDKDTLLRAVRNVAADHAAIIPESMHMEFIDAKAQGNAQIFEKLAEYLDRQISKLVLGQTGTTDAGSRVGTANAHEHVRQDIEQSDAVQLAATLNRDVVRPLVALNLGERQRYPRLRIYRPESEDITALVHNVATLLPFGLRVEQSVLADRLGLPDPDKGAVCLAAGPVAQEAVPSEPKADRDDEAKARAHVILGEAKNPCIFTPVPPKATAAVQATPAHHDDSPDSIEQYIEEELGGWQPVTALTDPVEALLQECQSYDELAARLPEALQGQDATALAQSLALALFVARFEAETAGKAPINVADVPDVPDGPEEEGASQ